MTEELGFETSQQKGFHVTFANGLTLSVQWGDGNYCENRDMLNFDRATHAPKCSNAEIAIWDADGNFVTGMIYKKLYNRELYGDVDGWLTPEEVADLMFRVSQFNQKNDGYHFGVMTEIEME